MGSLVVDMRIDPKGDKQIAIKQPCHRLPGNAGIAVNAESAANCQSPSTNHLSPLTTR
jgi:hypothetical protein